MADKFTPQEKACLRLLIRGKSAKQIAKNLGLSQRTVEYYLAKAKGKVNAYNRGDLIEKVFEQFAVMLDD